MNTRFTFLVLIMICISIPSCLWAQQQVTVISRCGGTETVTIPSIRDVDGDGMDDRLEQLLLNTFMPKVIQFSDESCPGPALNGTGDSNLIVCHIYPVPQQYTRSSSYDSIRIHPLALVPARGLTPGLIWYQPLVKVNTAILYGKDCGALGHTSDVEGFNFSLKYIGPDTLAGWMYDTVMSRWKGDTIQTVSHASTLCEHVETRPMKSLYIPYGADSIYASPDKHGNYLTIGGCGSSFICNPGCGGQKQVKHVRNINIGEPGAALVADLGSVYPAYAGNDPWSTMDFLDAQGGDAGTIRAKMLLPLTNIFLHGQLLTAQQICPLYTRCFGPFGSGYSYETCAGSSYRFHSRVLTQSGTYRDTLSNGNGCDSVVTLSLNVLPLDTHSYQVSVCDGYSYSFHGQQLSSSGVYYDTLSDVHSCDSVVRLSLTVRPPAAYSYSAVSCDTAYTFAGVTLSAPGIYADTLTSVAGCDSIVTLSLIMDSMAVTWSTGIPDTVAAYSHAILLTGAQPAGGIFSGPAVHGNIFFTDSLAPGTYVLTYAYTDALGCSGFATKAIEIISTSTGSADVDFAGGITLYPNPVTDILSAESVLFTSRDVTIIIYDMMGKAIAMPCSRSGEVMQIDCAQLDTGVYTVKFAGGSQTTSRRFLKTR